jgi:hypothetical protein
MFSFEICMKDYSLPMQCTRSRRVKYVSFNLAAHEDASEPLHRLVLRAPATFREFGIGARSDMDNTMRRWFIARHRERRDDRPFSA